MVRLKRGAEGSAPLVEITGVGRVQRLVVGGDPVGDLLDVIGAVPEVGIVSRLLVQQVRDGDQLATLVRRKELGAPVVVARSVQDHVVGGGEGPGVPGAALILMRVGVGVGDDAGHRDVRATQLGGDAAPEVLPRHHLQGGSRGGGSWSPAAGEPDGQQHRPCQEPADDSGGHVILSIIAQCERTTARRPDGLEFLIQGLHKRGRPALWSRERQSSTRTLLERRCSLYYGGGGLLIVLGIIALVIGWTLVGIILIILGLLSGGWGFYGSRRAP